jgi:hypothetical protein
MWPPLQAGTGRGVPGLAPGRCEYAVTSLLQRASGGTVCGRQDIVFVGEEEGGGVRSGPGAVMTVLLFQIITTEC